MSDEYVDMICQGEVRRARPAGDRAHNGGFWGITEDGHLIEADRFPWHRGWFFLRNPNRQVRVENLEAELGHRLPALFAAWAQWQATGVKPPTPDGINEGFMEVWGGRDLDRHVWCHT